MRFFLDENVPVRVGLVLQALGHEAVHVQALGLTGAPDAKLALVAREYDVFVTLDLHRQEAEWIAINRAIVEHGIKVLRLRPPKPRSGVPVRPEAVVLGIIRQLTFDTEEWLAALEGDAVLITIAREERAFRARSRAEVAEVLERRLSPD